MTRHTFPCMILLAVFTLGLACTSSVFAQPATETEAPPAGQRSIFDDLQLQPGDDALQRFQPRETRTPESRLRGEALAWFMTGRLHEERGDNDQAITAYRNAIRLAPTELQPYEALIPLLVGNRSTRDEARAIALQACQHQPAAFGLARRLAIVFVQMNGLDTAIEFLQEVAGLDNLRHNSLVYLQMQRDLGLYFRIDGQLPSAVAAYQIVFEALQNRDRYALTKEQWNELLGDPGETYEEFGALFLEAQLPELALQAYEQAAAHQESQPAIYSYNLALVFRQTGKPQEALDELQKYFNAQLRSKGREAYQLLADLLSELDRGDEVIPQLEELARQDRRNETLQYFLADRYLAADRLDEAAALYQRTLGNSNNPYGLLGLTTVYHRNRDVDKLFTALLETYVRIPEIENEQMAARLNPDVLQLVQRFTAERTAILADEELTDALMNRGRTLQEGDEPPLTFPQAYVLGKLADEAKRTDDVISFYEFAIGTQNDPPLDLYRELGSHLLDARRYEKAAEVFREAADHPAPQLQAARWFLLYLLSYALEFDGQTEEALAAIAEAQGAQPGNSQLVYQEGWIYSHAKRWEEAEAKLKQVLTDYPNDTAIVRTTQFTLSNLYVQQGDLPRGEQILEDVLREDPENPQANNDLGYLWADNNKNLDRALVMIEKALQTEPDNAAYLDSMGWVLYRLERYDEALGYLQQAIADRGMDGTILDHLGDCLSKLDRHTEAREAWQQALDRELEQASPDNKLVEALRTKLAAEEPATSNPVVTDPPVTDPVETAQPAADTPAETPATDPNAND